MPIVVSTSALDQEFIAGRLSHSALGTFTKLGWDGFSVCSATVNAESRWNWRVPMPLFLKVRETQPSVGRYDRTGEEHANEAI